MRDCHNVEVMLYSQTEVSKIVVHNTESLFLQPVVESSTNIKFLPQTYAYDELFEHFMGANISPWTNLWTDVFDFTPHKKSETGEPNFFTTSNLEKGFIRPLEQTKQIIENAKQRRNGEEVKGLQEIEPAELEEIEAEVGIVDGLSEAHLEFDLGDYFNKFSSKMLRTVPPTRQFSGQKQVYKHSFFLLCFVHDFESIFDSIVALKQG